MRAAGGYAVAELREPSEGSRDNPSLFSQVVTCVDAAPPLRGMIPTNYQRNEIMTDSQGAALPAFTEHRVQHAGGSLYVRDLPGSGPAFVLLHGFPDNSHIYDDLIPHLAAAGRRTIAFDFLGFGAGPAFAQMTYQLFDEMAANTARLSDFRRSDLPLLLIWGKADPYLHVSVAEHLKSQAKNAAIHVLEAGHWPQIDEAADTARIMLASQWS
jgi:pimeloyl-ACP methyl ester carboxylesterase